MKIILDKLSEIDFYFDSIPLVAKNINFKNTLKGCVL